MSSSTVTVREASEMLNLSRVRILGLVKQGVLKGEKEFVSGTNIPIVRIEKSSLSNYNATRKFTGERSMIVNLPADELDELRKICEENGWLVRDKNNHNK